MGSIVNRGEQGDLFTVWQAEVCGVQEMGCDCCGPGEDQWSVGHGLRVNFIKGTWCKQLNLAPESIKRFKKLLALNQLGITLPVPVPHIFMTMLTKL